MRLRARSWVVLGVASLALQSAACGDDGDPAPLTVTCTASPAEGNTPLAVSFSATPAGGGGSYTYAWSFGDGQTSTSQSPSHTYQALGAHAATVTVTSASESATCTRTVTVRLEKSVTVPSGGSSAQLSFSGTSGQKLRFTLKASKSTTRPYGYLQAPDSSGAYVPLETAASNGSNTGEATLTQTGAYAYTVFDGANQGDSVQVKIEVAK